VSRARSSRSAATTAISSSSKSTLIVNVHTKMRSGQGPRS
jgi:hypothetical protein